MICLVCLGFGLFYRLLSCLVVLGFVWFELQISLLLRLIALFRLLFVWLFVLVGVLCLCYGFVLLCCLCLLSWFVLCHDLFVFY